MRLKFFHGKLEEKVSRVNQAFSANKIFKFVLAEPASCESDKDCLKGKAKCIRRECHCIGDYDFGDGKTQCDSKCKTFCKEFLFPIQNETNSFFSVC